MSLEVTIPGRPRLFSLKVKHAKLPWTWIDLDSALHGGDCRVTAVQGVPVPWYSLELAHDRPTCCGLRPRGSTYSYVLVEKDEKWCRLVAFAGHGRSAAVHLFCCWYRLAGSCVRACNPARIHKLIINRRVRCHRAGRSLAVAGHRAPCMWCV